MNQKWKNNILEIFQKKYSKNPELFVKSPSRINIIGEHIDYLGGDVLPANIDLYIYGAFTKSKTIDFYSSNFNQDNIKSNEIKEKFKFKKENSFMNYVLGCYQVLWDNGYKIGGFSAVVHSEIPTSSGLSSSAAFGVLIIKGISTLYGYNIDNVEVSKLFKEVENNFMNLKNGIMDQFIIANGKANNLMLLNTSTLEFKNFPVELDDYNFLVINSKKPRNLIESKYNERVEETSEALKIINQKYNYSNLCSIPIAKKEECLSLITNPIIKKRTKYAIEEQMRVKNMIEALTKKDFLRMGEILNEGHEALKNEYEVSCEESDFINKFGNSINGVLGIRMTGAGFGGCSIALINKKNNKEFKEKLSLEYKNKFNYECEIYEINVVDGARCFKPNN